MKIEIGSGLKGVAAAVALALLPAGAAQASFVLGFDTSVDINVQFDNVNNTDLLFLPDPSGFAINNLVESNDDLAADTPFHWAATFTGRFTLDGNGGEAPDPVSGLVDHSIDLGVATVDQLFAIGNGGFLTVADLAAGIEFGPDGVGLFAIGDPDGVFSLGLLTTQQSLFNLLSPLANGPFENLDILFDGSVVLEAFAWVDDQQPPARVPEPMGLALLGSGLIGLGWVRRRRA